MKTQYLSLVGLHFPVNWPGLAFSSFLRLSWGISCRLMPWLLALQGEETAASGKRNRGEGGQGLGCRHEDQTWSGRQEEKAKAQRAHWLAPRRHLGSGFHSRFKPTTHPGCRSGGLGMGLLKPTLPTSQYVSSTPLPWRNTKEGRFTQTRVRDGEALGQV